MIAEITRADVQRALAEDPALVVLEALPARSFADGHLPGAHRVAAATVVDQIAGLAADRAAPIVVYCASATCRNSHAAAAALTEAGYANVRVYVEGKQGWAAAGLPLAR